MYTSWKLKQALPLILLIFLIGLIFYAVKISLDRFADVNLHVNAVLDPECRGVSLGTQNGQKPPFKYQRNAVFLLMLSNKKYSNFEMPEKPFYSCSKPFYVT